MPLVTGSYKIWRSPFVKWEDEKLHAIFVESNPSRIEIEEELESEVVNLIGGRSVLRTLVEGPGPSSGGTEVRTNPRRMTITFPLVERNFVDLLQTHYRFGLPIAIRCPSLLDTLSGISEKLEPDSQRKYFYTRFGPFDEFSIELKDRGGGSVYTWSSTGTQNPYGFGIEPDEGRISTGSTLPMFGEMYAEYNPIFYGRIVSLEVNPAPGWEVAKFAPTLTVHEISWPSITRAVRLYLRNTASNESSPPTSTQSETADTGHFTAPTGRAMSTSKGSAATTKASSGATGAIESLAQNFVSGELAPSIIPKDTPIQVAAGIQLSGAATTGNLEVFVSIWRKKSGRKHTLLQASATVKASGQITDGGLKWGIVEGTVPESIQIDDGDRLLVEIWGKKDATAGSETVTLSWDGQTVGGASNSVVSDPAAYIQMGHPFYLKG